MYVHHACSRRDLWRASTFPEHQPATAVCLEQRTPLEGPPDGWFVQRKTSFLLLWLNIIHGTIVTYLIPSVMYSAGHLGSEKKITCFVEKKVEFIGDFHIATGVTS